MNGKSVVITEADFDRLNGLVHSRKGGISDGPLVVSLGQELSRGEIVASADVPKKVVTMNSKVRVRDIRSDERETYTLVYPQEADINEGRLSILAPLATALLGTKARDVVEVKTPGGVRKIKVERILYQPEAAGDLHL